MVVSDESVAFRVLAVIDILALAKHSYTHTHDEGQEGLVLFSAHLDVARSQGRIVVTECRLVCSPF